MERGLEVEKSFSTMSEEERAVHARMERKIAESLLHESSVPDLSKARKQEVESMRGKPFPLFFFFFGEGKKSKIYEYTKNRSRDGELRGLQEIRA